MIHRDQPQWACPRPASFDVVVAIDTAELLPVYEEGRARRYVVVADKPNRKPPSP